LHIKEHQDIQIKNRIERDAQRRETTPLKKKEGREIAERKKKNR